MLLFHFRVLLTYFNVYLSNFECNCGAFLSTQGKEPLLQDHKILLLEAAPKQDHMKKAPTNYSNRVSSITPGSSEILQGTFKPDILSKIIFLFCEYFYHALPGCGTQAQSRISQNLESGNYIIVRGTLHQVIR